MTTAIARQQCRSPRSCSWGRGFRGPARVLAGSRPYARRISRSILGVALVLAGVLPPLESGDLPDSLGDSIGSSPASAQAGGLVEGELDDCPTDPRPYEAVDPNCVLVVPACPENPLVPKNFSIPENPLIRDDFMLPSTGYSEIDGVERYPEFCEARVLQAKNGGAYDICMATSTGYAVQEYEILVDDPQTNVVEAVPSPGCRLIVPKLCVVGTHRVDRNSCRSVQRRTWTCLPEQIPTNDFNTCYQAPDLPDGEHPACGEGAPDLVVLSCSIYVGSDFARAAGDMEWNCDSRFPTKVDGVELRAYSRSDLSAVYWCEFDPSYLRVECHGSPPPSVGCGSTTAICLKRASSTGGCASIAATIRCRSLQAKSIASDSDLAEIRAEIRDNGCAPCVLLPFEAVPTECPDEIANQPVAPSSYRDKLAAIHAFRRDYAIGAPDCSGLDPGDSTEDLQKCFAHDVCADPPRGRLDWSSSHFSQLAVVNSPVIVLVLDIPNDKTSRRALVQTGRNVFVYLSPRTVLRYPAASDKNYHVLQFPQLDSGHQYDDVRSLVVDSDRGECFLDTAPSFRVRIEELWPDIDRAEIERLFRGQSLDWWDKLSDDEKIARSKARGFDFVPPSATGAEQKAERESRVTEQQKEILCNVGKRTWCRWLSTRSGYFRLTGAASWILSSYGGARRWVDSELRQKINDRLAEKSVALADSLTDWGLDPTDMGVNSSVTALLPQPLGTDDEWLYSDSAGETMRCPAMDLRINCGGTFATGNYTETESIGIMVHEMRVATRTPNS